MSGKKHIKTWVERCEEHPDHNGIVSERMIKARMQEEIDELREEYERLRGLLTEARGAKWLVVQDNLLDRIDAALRRED